MIKNERLAGQKVVSAFGELEFDNDGLLVTDVSEDAEEVLASVPGFSKVEVEKKESAKKETVEEVSTAIEEKKEKPSRKNRG